MMGYPKCTAKLHKLLHGLLRQTFASLCVCACSMMTEGAGQFVLLIICMTMGTVPKATVIGHEGRVCKLFNEYYIQYQWR